MLYATEGIEGLSLRTIAERGAVNLAAVNYYFRTKVALTEAMLERALGPLCDERLALLAQLESECRSSLRPTHVLAAILLPMVRELIQPDIDATHRRQLLFRLTTDQSPVVRNFLIAAFQPRADQFDAAFIRCTPQLAPAEVLLRARLFCNALPGSLNNANTVVICQSLLQRANIDCREILIYFASQLESGLSELFGAIKVPEIVDEVLHVLSGTRTLREVERHLALSPARRGLCMNGD